MNTFNKDELLARLRNGASVEDIANDMTKLLNEANRDYEAECAKAAEAEAKAKQLETEKKVAFENMMDGLLEYIGNYCIPEDQKEAFIDLTFDLDYNSMMSVLDKDMSELASLMQLFLPKMKNAEKAAPSAAKPRVKVTELSDAEADRIIADMLKRFGL